MKIEAREWMESYSFRRNRSANNKSLWIERSESVLDFSSARSFYAADSERYDRKWIELCGSNMALREKSVSGFLGKKERKRKKRYAWLNSIDLVRANCVETCEEIKRSRLCSSLTQACAIWTRVLNESGNRRLSNTILMAIHAKRNYPFHSI